MSIIAHRGACWLLELSYALSPRRLARGLRAVLARQASRAALARMDDRMLADIGLTHEQALMEAAKPIWKP